MKSPKKEKKKFNTYIIPSLLMSIIIIAILSSFGIRMVDEAQKQVEKDYQVDVTEICKAYEKYIYAIEKSSDIIVGEVLDDTDLISDDHIDHLKRVADAMSYKNVYLIGSDFSAVDIYGNQYNAINEKPPFDDVFDNKMGLNKFLTNENGEEALYIFKPVATKNSLKGYVIIEYVPEVIGNIVNTPKFSGKNTYALISSDGAVIEAAGAKSTICTESGNIVDAAKNILYVNGSYNSFSQAVNDCRKGSIQIIYKEDGKYIYYSPITGTKALVMMFVSTSDVERSFADVSKNIRSMLFEIGVTIIAFLAIFVIIGIINRAKYSIESEDLQNKADTDLLTDLYNKIATERLIKEYLEGEGKNSVSMLFVLDVDDFKKINDTKGHAFGDQVLSQLGHQIRAWFRVNDIVGRIGGDEFMIFIKDVKNPENIKREGSRIMQFFDGFNVGEYAKYSPTASVGGAVFPTDATDFESLYKAADKAVYKSKKEGKNRVSFYSDLNIIEKDTEVNKKDLD